MSEEEKGGEGGGRRERVSRERETEKRIREQRVTG